MTTVGTPERPAFLEEVPRLAGRKLRSRNIVLTPEMCDQFEHSTKLFEVFPDLTARRQPGVPAIVEGFMSMSMVDALIGTVLRYDPETVQTLNYGVDRSRFTRPIRCGETVWADIEVKSVREKGDAYLVDYRCDLKSGENELFAVVQWTVHASRRPL